MGDISKNILHHNGQRIYQPPTNRPPPAKGSEVFVGNLPRDLFEEELVKMFSFIGPIYRLRLMMDFSGQTRGFCFVHFFTPEDAQKAICKWDEATVTSATRKAQISVHLSVDNRRLYFGQIPRTMTEQELRKELVKMLEGIVEVIIFWEEEKNSAKLRNRGFAFVEFESHAKAAIARRKMLTGVLPFWDERDDKGAKSFVDWAEPEPMVCPTVLSEVKILYLKYVPLQWSIDYFKQIVMDLLPNLRVVRIYKRDNYAFIHFYDRSDAEIGKEILEDEIDGLNFYGKKIQVEWARPVKYSRRNRATERPNNLCTSVPPRQRRQVEQAKETYRRKSVSPTTSSGSGRSDLSSPVHEMPNEQASGSVQMPGPSTSRQAEFFEEMKLYKLF